MHPKRSLQIGQIYTMRFDGEGSVQNGLRPGLVFQNNVGNKFSPNIIALPLTSALKKSNMPTHVLVPSDSTGLYRDSVVLCENPTCVSKQNVGDYITTLPPSIMKEVAIASVLATSAISFVPKEALEELWDSAVALNKLGA